MPGFPSCGQSDTTISEFLLSDHVLNDFSADMSMMFEKDYERFVQLDDEARTITAPSKIDWAANRIDGTIRLRPADRHGDDPNDIADFSNAIDDDSSSATSIGAAERLLLKLRNGNISGTFELVGLADIIITVVVTNFNAGAGDNGDITFSVKGVQSSSSVITGNGTFTLTAAAAGVAAGSLPTNWQDLIQWGFGCDNLGGGATSSFDLNDIYVTVQDLTYSTKFQEIIDSGRPRRIDRNKIDDVI